MNDQFVLRMNEELVSDKYNKTEQLSSIMSSCAAN